MGCSPDESAAFLRFHLICLRGKIALGEGDEAVGEKLPSLMSAAGLERVEVRMNDRVASMIPPYESAPERANADEMIDLAERQFCMWNKEGTKKRFLAGGGDESSFDATWVVAMDQRARIAGALRDKRYACSGGGLFYVAWGRKPIA
jgi:hypothetical protein